MRDFETGWLDLLILFSLLTRGITVKRFSVPEEHFLFLHCDSNADDPNIEWRNGKGEIIALQNGAAVSYLNQNKYHISDGYLQIKELELSDAGQYFCNGHLEAEVEVLRGQVFSISEGRTLLIPCESDRKQVWSFKKEKSSRRVTIFTLFKNGTIIRERDDPQGRFVLHRRALEIVRLELEDSGRYMCNSNLVAKVTVIKAHQDQFNQTTSVVMDTIVTDSPEIPVTSPIFQKVAVVSVIGLCVLVSSVLLVSLILCQRKRTRRRKNKKNGRLTGTGHQHEETELQLQGLSTRGSPKTHRDLGQSLPADGRELHYASLGRQNWLERGRMQDNDPQVIYSTVAVAMNPTSE